jgi:hypothetical protein
LYIARGERGRLTPFRAQHHLLGQNLCSALRHGLAWDPCCAPAPAVTESVF